MLEKILFNVVAFALFVIIFFKMIKNNDMTYLIALAMEAIGIALNFIILIFTLETNWFIKLILYLLSIIIPIIVLYLEHRKINLTEIISISMAKIAILFNNNKKAKNILIGLISKYSNSKIGHKMLAQIYEQEGGMRKAIDEYVKVVEIDKQDYDSYYKITLLLKDLGNKDEAIEMLKNLNNKKPDFLEATITLSDLLCEQERYKEALTLVTEALKYHPNNYDLYYSMGIIYTMLNDFNNAKTCYEKAATINTLLHTTDYNIAQINLILGDIEEAEKYFMKCVDDEELSAKAYFYIAKICMLRNDKDNAIKYLNVSIDLDPIYYKKAEEEPLFIPIKSLINYPSIDEEDIEERKTNLSLKEIKAQNHLETTYKLVGKLSYNDLKLRNNNINIERDTNREREN